MDTLALLSSERLEYGTYSSLWHFDAKETDRTLSKQQTIGIQNNTIVRLKMPTVAYLFDLGKLPYPEIRFSMSVGDSIHTSHIYPTDVNGYDSTEVKGYIKVIDYEEETVEYGGYDRIIKTWTLEANNLDNPEYKAIFTYNSNYGFTNFKYYLTDKEIEINHYSTTHMEY